MTEPADLAALAVADWSRLVRGYADAAAPLAHASDRASAPRMCERMLVRAAKEGAGALAWARRPLALPALVAGAGRQPREQFVALAELATTPDTVPVAFAQVHRAFADDEAREPALVAMFLEAARKAELLVEQLALAGQAEPNAREAAIRLERALPRAHLRAFRPRVRTLADFDRVRATGYTDAPARVAGRVAEVARSGLAWYGHVLRKADVIVFETAT